MPLSLKTFSSAEDSCNPLVKGDSMNFIKFCILIFPIGLLAACVSAPQKPVAMAGGPEREVASTTTSVRIVKSIPVNGSFSGKSQNCADGVISPNPVVHTFNHVGFDQAGNARLVFSSLEISDCTGISGPESLSITNDKRESIDQTQMSSWAKNDISRALHALEVTPKDCAFTVTLGDDGKIIGSTTPCNETSP